MTHLEHGLLPVREFCDVDLSACPTLVADPTTDNTHQNVGRQTLDWGRTRPEPVHAVDKVVERFQRHIARALLAGLSVRPWPSSGLPTHVKILLVWPVLASLGHERLLVGQ